MDPPIFKWLPPVTFSGLITTVRSSLPALRAPFTFRGPADFAAPPPHAVLHRPAAADYSTAPVRGPTYAAHAAAATTAATATAMAVEDPPPFSVSTQASFSAQAFHARMLDLSSGLGGLSVHHRAGSGGAGVVARAEAALEALAAARVPPFDPDAEAEQIMRPLTGEEAARVKAILAAADPNTELSFIEGNHFTVKEARELRPRIWLTDGTINVFLLALRLLAEAALAKGDSAKHRHTWPHNTFFWAKLQGCVCFAPHGAPALATRAHRRPPLPPPPPPGSLAATTTPASPRGRGQRGASAASTFSRTEGCLCPSTGGTRTGPSR